MYSEDAELDFFHEKDSSRHGVSYLSSWSFLASICVLTFSAGGHCQSLKPIYEKAAQSLKGLAKVAAIDCDEEKNKRLCGEYGIQGFPTLKVFKPGKKKGKPIIEGAQAKQDQL